MSDTAADLRLDVRRGIAWSTLNNLALRAGTFAVGVVLARVLAPEQFGVYAVALAVQAVLMTLADLGLGVDLIRTDDPARLAPTIATIGLVSGLVLAGLMMLTAHPLAGVLGSPESGDVIALLAVTLALAGAGVVPYAMLCRRFQQRQLFAIALVDFAVSTVVTLVLVRSGLGVMSLAVARITAQAVTLVLQHVVARTRPRLGFDREVAWPSLRFGLPVAGANLLSWALLNIDTIVIARIAGPVALGFYFLAFNISSWPMAAIGQVARSIALPAFARVPGHRAEASLTVGIALTWSLALPAGALLAALSVPLVEVVYGPRWAPAVPVLAALGLFGALRVVFDLMSAYLLSCGASRTVLWIQVAWCATLVPAMIAGTHWFGIAGGGWAHLVIAVAITLPTYVLALRSVGADTRRLLTVAWPPLAIALLAAPAGFAVTRSVERPVVALVAGAVVGGTLYLALVQRWLRRVVAAETTSTTTAQPSPAAAPATDRPLLGAAR